MTLLKRKSQRLKLRLMTLLKRKSQRLKLQLMMLLRANNNSAFAMHSVQTQIDSKGNLLMQVALFRLSFSHILRACSLET